MNLNNIVLEFSKCDLCGSDKSKHLFCMPDIRNRRLEIEYCVVECLNCNHRFLNPRPSLKDIKLFYTNEYYAERSSSDKRQVQRYTKQTGYLPPVKNGKILDVGCAGGGWLKTLLSQGWDCYGQDFIESPFIEKDIKIDYGYLTDLMFKNCFFDIVTAWGVMEHVHEPSKYFCIINSILKQGGHFIFLVPNGNSLWSRWAYKEDIPRHLHFFTSQVLQRYAEKYCFELEKIILTNKIYSKPATGRGLFRTNFLLKVGENWQGIVNTPKNNILKLGATMMTLLDYLLIHPVIEEKMGLAGNMIAFFKKK